MNERYRVAERWVEPYGLRYCVVDQDGQIVTHSAVESVAQSKADEWNGTKIGQWIRKSKIELSDKAATCL